jgi:thioesterase domain-containing protein
MTDPLLADLQKTIEGEIPICAHMGIEVDSYDQETLTMRAPLAQNHNHQGTGFAGSLNALCTVCGWGRIYLLARELGIPPRIVIRRSTIKYLRPVDQPRIIARCLPIDPDELSHFVAMLKEKGTGKIDLHIEIADAEGPAVSLHGSYVVLADH